MMDNRFEAAFSTFLDRHEKIAEINKKRVYRKIGGFLFRK